MDRKMNGWMPCMHGCTDGRMGGWTGGRMDRCMDGWLQWMRLLVDLSELGDFSDQWERYGWVSWWMEI